MEQRADPQRHGGGTAEQAGPADVRAIAARQIDEKKRGRRGVGDDSQIEGDSRKLLHDRLAERRQGQVLPTLGENARQTAASGPGLFAAESGAHADYSRF